MEKVLSTIIEQKLILKGDVVAVACSGGSDSMALLHKLNSIKNQIGFSVLSVTVNHSIRENGERDANFVKEYCEKNNIKCYVFKVDVPKLAKQKQQSLESAGRYARYGIFDELIKKGIATKIALAHHIQDQAETILLHLFRGAGLSGVRGMSYNKNGVYIRPLLSTSKDEILKYIKDNDVPFVVDETNYESEFTRNYLRNQVFPVILKKWPNFIDKLLSFNKSVIEDDDYINKNVFTDAVLFDDKTAKIPLSYFLYDKAIISRIIFKTLAGIGINVDIEKKHIDAIIELASNKNGKKISLPLGVVAHKEYDYLTLTSKKLERNDIFKEFRCGTTFEVCGFGKVCVKKATQIKDDGALYLDAKKIPKNAVWRYRKEGDVIEKFGGGTKKLKSFLIDKKVPQRQRDLMPVIAYDGEIYAVAGLDISNKVKVDNDTKVIVKITVE